MTEWRDIWPAVVAFVVVLAGVAWLLWLDRAPRDTPDRRAGGVRNPDPPSWPEP